MAATIIGAQQRSEVTNTDLSGATLVTLVFCTAMLATGAIVGGTLIAVALSALLVIGSALVSVGGDALTPRQAANLGFVHLIAFVLLSF